LIMQRRFENLPQQLVALRRKISDWKQLSSGQQTSLINMLKLNMRERGIQSDFYHHLEKLKI